MVPANRAAAVAAELADIRRELAPERGTPRTKDRHCVNCGELFTVWEGDDVPYCADCGMERQMSANQQMHLKQGPIYEKAARKQLAFWLAEAKRLGITPEA